MPDHELGSYAAALICYRSPIGQAAPSSHPCARRDKQAPRKYQSHAAALFLRRRRASPDPVPRHVPPSETERVRWKARVAWLIGIALTIAGTIIAWLAWQHPRSPPSPPSGNGSAAAFVPRGNTTTPSTGVSFFDTVVLEPPGDPVTSDSTRVTTPQAPGTRLPPDIFRMQPLAPGHRSQPCQTAQAHSGARWPGLIGGQLRQSAVPGPDQPRGKEIPSKLVKSRTCASLPVWSNGMARPLGRMFISSAPALA
jgi:hypothetical protein